MKYRFQSRAGILLLALIGLGILVVSMHPDPAAWLRGDLPLPAPWLLLSLLVLATLISEDLTCISAGLLVSQEAIAFLPATLACFTGIFIGDSLLYLAGLYWGRPALNNAWVRRIISPDKTARAERFFQRRGPWLILATRFLPGSRVPTYFAAGAMHLRPAVFFLFFALGASLWTPILVGLAVLVGTNILSWLQGFSSFGLPLMVLTAGLLYFLVRWCESLFTWKGRRRWVSLYHRLTRWEFWPPLAVYPPVVLYYLWLGMKYRNLTLPSLANPLLPLGGWVESKSLILSQLADRSPEIVGSFRLISPESDPQLRLQRALEAIPSWPVVIKPDQGERGTGVQILEKGDDLSAYLQNHPEPLIIQQYHGGLEFGIYWERDLNSKLGTITSLALKKPLSLVGDGHRTLEELILAHPRAVCKVDAFLKRFPHAGNHIPSAGEVISLAPIGSHSTGAVFWNRPDLRTPALTEALNELLGDLPGFSLGRFDLKAPTEDDLKAGRNLRIIELNGITSEPSHIYHPHYPYWKGIRDLCRQWKRAFQWGDAFRKQGFQPPPLSLLVRVNLAHVFRKKPSSAPRPPSHPKAGDAFPDIQQIPISPNNG